MKACYLFFVCAGFLLSTAYAQVDHSAWDALLKKHVKEGRVDYKGFRSDSVALWAYVDDLSQNPPQEDWSRAAQLAYWINGLQCVYGKTDCGSLSVGKHTGFASYG